MGHPKFSRPKYDSPAHPWKAARIEEEHAIRTNHGLKTMKEIWKAKSVLRRYRGQAMKLIGRVDMTAEHWQGEEQDMLLSMYNKGFIVNDATLDDVLSLAVEDVLNRRLQAQVYYKGLAMSMKQARQLVVHGHISIGDQKVTIPSYPVSRSEEEEIKYALGSDLHSENHSIRQSIEGVRQSAEYGEEEIIKPEVAKDEAEVIAEAVAAAPSAEDTIPKESEA
ncbi:MAG: 30S ribosomal protein S4 [Candidatus Poseidoniales archaeon]|jgi:small subunit ribosomal protein S4|tara:strand:+ start:230 stop:895 length:666 start_codon:yes stop_codon:yes gene_type:complete